MNPAPSSSISEIRRIDAFAVELIKYNVAPGDIPYFQFPPYSLLLPQLKTKGKQIHYKIDMDYKEKKGEGLTWAGSF